MANVEVKGLAELHKTLQDLPVKIEGNVMRGAMRAGANVIKDEARKLAPVGDPYVNRNKSGDAALHHGGTLRDSLRVSARISRKLGQVSATVKAGGKNAWYAHLVEFGTAAHLIKPKNRKSLFFAGINKELINHPGAKKNPFMRVAFDRKAHEAIDAIASYIRNRLPKEIGKLGK